MAFVLSKSATYTWPVRISLATDGGKKTVETLDVEFRRLPQSRITELVRQARAAERNRGDDDEQVDDREAAREIIAGWDGVTDDAGKAIPFSEAALGQLLEIPTVAGQIVQAWFESLKEGKRKN
jgi:hypothetical protein